MDVQMYVVLLCMSIAVIAYTAGARTCEPCVPKIEYRFLPRNFIEEDAEGSGAFALLQKLEQNTWGEDRPAPAYAKPQS